MVNTGVSPVRRFAGLAVLAVLGGGLAGGAALLEWAGHGTVAAVRAPGPATFDQLLLLGATAVAWALLAWLTTGLLLCVLAAASPARRLTHLAELVAPAALRRMAAVILGLGLVAASTALAFPATADEGVAGLSGWTPDRPGGPPPLVVARAPAPARRPSVGTDVVVRPGDTLWGIAARHLPPTASAGRVARAWPRWYAANRRVLGPDPDLIQPGTHLVPPPREAR